jgi:hypothetical protein
MRFLLRLENEAVSPKTVLCNRYATKIHPPYMLWYMAPMSASTTICGVDKISNFIQNFGVKICAIVRLTSLQLSRIIYTW